MFGHEFQIHDRVNELLKLLGVQNAKEIAPSISEHMEKNRVPFNSAAYPMHLAKAKLAENCSNPDEFIQKYDDLKTRNLRDLDALVYFLSEINERPEIRNILTSKSLINESTTTNESQNNVTLTSSNSSGQTKFSATALAEMKEKVMKSTFANEKTAYLPTNIFSSIHKLADKQMPRAKREINNCPEYPSWVHERSFLSWDFYPNTDKFESDSEIGKLSISLQEDMIIEDLLNCMSGIEGKYIRTPCLIDKHAERAFHVDRLLDPAMRELAKRILPVCSNYSLIIRFVEEKSHFKWGLVNHALCSAIKELLKNHHLFVCQLENLHRNGNLSLQKLWYYVNPIMGFMEVLASIIKVINKGDCCGSSIINLLFEKVLIYSGDSSLQELIFYLAQTASKPYLQMLEDWIYKGQINDPYNEFMIVEDKEISKERLKDEFNEKFWEKKYSANRNNMPKFLEQISDKILLTGKYLNAIYETGKIIVRNEKDINSNDLRALAATDQDEVKEQDEKIEIKLNNRSKIIIPNATEIIFTTKEEFYKQVVDNAYNYSSKILLNLLLKDHKLIDRLRSLKHYFLLDQSDFMVHFMDISEEEMSKNVKEIKENRLESLLELSLRITSANSDPYKDDLKVKLFKNDLKSMITRIQMIDAQSSEGLKIEPSSGELTGLNAFSLDYVVKWPLSLIINRKTLSKYQILFRHIFLMKDVERQLCNVWLCTKSGELCLGRSYKYYSMSCALKQRMLNFVQNLLNYMTFEVFESAWNTFMDNISNVSNVDDVINHHTNFLDSCLRDCLVTSKSFMDILKILGVCSMFSTYVQAITMSSKTKEESAKIDMKLGFKAAQEKRKLALQEIGEDLNKIVSSETFAKSISDFEKQFSHFLLELLGKIIKEMGSGLGETKIGNVLYRLDFNDHYRDQLEKLSKQKTMNEQANLSLN